MEQIQIQSAEDKVTTERSPDILYYKILCLDITCIRTREFTPPTWPSDLLTQGTPNSKTWTDHWRKDFEF